MSKKNVNVVEVNVCRSVKIQRDKLDVEQRAAVTRVLNALGLKRVIRAMTHTCTPTYKNDGWDNCFMTQAMGGVAASGIYKIPSIDPARIIACKLAKVPVTPFHSSDAAWKLETDINTLIECFDEEFQGESFPTGGPIHRGGMIYEFYKLVDRWIAKQGQKGGAEAILQKKYRKDISQLVARRETENLK